MNIMVTGSGGREHALAWKIAEDEGQALTNLYVAPGNAGTGDFAENVPIPGNAGPDEFVKFAKQNKVDFTVIGPDDQLAAGIVDRFTEAGLAAFGPNQEAASVESSKSFAKIIMHEQGIPTAASLTFKDAEAAHAHIDQRQLPAYIKADGLALGKGSEPAYSPAEAHDIIDAIMVAKKHGKAGERIVIEDHLGGPENPEISLHAITDGHTYKMFPAAMDHKTIFENHEGPMTGGMGTAAPLPGISDEQVSQLGEQVVSPLLDGLKDWGVTYKGLLYPGIKLVNGQPKVLEFNARFGDSETQTYLRLMESRLLPLLMASQEGTLDQVELKWRQAAAVCLVMASHGYPASSHKGDPIEGINAAEQLEGIKIFHAGTAIKDGRVVTNGGRVLGLTALAPTLQEAQVRAYDAAQRIHFYGSQMRVDIGNRAIQGFNL